MPINIEVLDTQHADLDDTFRRHAFEQLRSSGAVPVPHVVVTSPSGADGAQRTLDVLVERGMAIVEDDELVAIDGLSIRPTKHRMTLGDDQLLTWCAADAVGIPAALVQDSAVVTTCPHCSAEIVVPNFFCNREHLGAWRSQAGDPEGETLDADGAAEWGDSGEPT
jgi:Alkylmercury lyase